jgi:hypothetical protein
VPDDARDRVLLVRAHGTAGETTGILAVVTRTGDRSA